MLILLVDMANASDDYVLDDVTQRRWLATRASELALHAFSHPGLTPSGIIYHMSRCGSTLASRMLGSIPRTISLIEPGVVSTALMHAMKEPSSPVLSSVLNTALRGLSGRFVRGYVKCTSWNLLGAPLLQAATPASPKIFLHRDPLEVMVSLMKAPPGWLHDSQGPIPPTLYEEDLTLEERMSHILELFLEAGLASAKAGDARMVAYPDLIARLIDGDLPKYFQYELDGAARDHMMESSRINSKQPGKTFTSDTKDKRASASPDLKKAAARLDGLYDEVLRHSQI